MIKDNKTRENFPMQTITLKRATMVGNQREGLTRRMSDAEFQAQRDKGLCLNCGERYFACHHCKIKEQRELRILVVWENDEEVEVIEENDQGEEKELKILEVEADLKSKAKISINFVVGMTNPGTMRLKGKIQEESVIILIDCGAIHNFIPEKLVSLLKLLTEETSNYGEMFGSSLAVKGKTVCEGVELVIGECKTLVSYPWSWGSGCNLGNAMVTLAGCNIG